MSSKPRLIETELGTEKLCIQCDEYWPLDSEFWYTSKGRVKKDGTQSICYEAVCKSCYDIRYRPHRIKRVNKIKSKHELVA